MSTSPGLTPGTAATTTAPSGPAQTFTGGNSELVARRNPPNSRFTYSCVRRTSRSRSGQRRSSAYCPNIIVYLPFYLEDLVYLEDLGSFRVLPHPGYRSAAPCSPRITG